MTLNITIVNPWGIWQCSDLRLTEWPSGEPRDYYSIKHVSVRATDGAALITYTGLGEVGQVSVSDWLRRIIRGEARTVEETLNLIRDRATADLGRRAAKLGIHHTFSVGAFLSGWPCTFLITNMDPSDPLNAPPLRKFTGAARMVHEYGPQAMVTGARGAVTQDDIALLNRIAARKPKRPVDYRRLMAEVNKRASKQRPFGNLISEACVAAYVPPAGEPFRREAHWWGLTGRASERMTPMISWGIDLTEVSRILLDKVEGLSEPDPARREKAIRRFDRLLHQASQRAVKSGSWRVG